MYTSQIILLTKHFKLVENSEEKIGAISRTQCLSDWNLDFVSVYLQSNSTLSHSLSGIEQNKNK